MKSFAKLVLGLIVIIFLFFSCEEDDDAFSQVATLKVVHAASGAPAVHVDYFGAEIESINFSINPTLRFGSDELFTSPANEPRDLRFTYATDTITEAYNTEVNLDAGQITTFFLIGDSANLSGFLITEKFQNYTDSVFGVSFINAASDLDAVSVRAIQTDTTGISDTTFVSNSLFSQTATGFDQYEASGRIDSYTFHYLNSADSILASHTIDPLRPRREKVFRNITIPLIGSSGDGEGKSSLRTIDIDNF